MAVVRPFRYQSAAEQLAAHLRREIADGQLSGSMPGILRLAKELEVSVKTLLEAQAQLEREGLLLPQGRGRASRIAGPKEPAAGGLKIGILAYSATDRDDEPLLRDIVHKLQQTGHTPEVMSKSLWDLGMDTGRVARYVQKNNKDAWIVAAGSRDILHWFSDQSIPVFALHGVMKDLPVAGLRIDKESAMREAVRLLVRWGHHRIVMLAREDHRKPVPGHFELAFLNELEAQGITTSSYHLPDWQENKADFHRCLGSLFQHTPPSALFISGLEVFVTAQLHLARRGILAPQHVSLICHDPPVFLDWCEPEISHIHFDHKSWPAEIARWANQIQAGKSDLRQRVVHAGFAQGGTIGPPPTP